MSNSQQTNTAHWGKAIFFALLFLLILFLLFSRSSCSRNLEAARNADAQSETASEEPGETAQEEEEGPSEDPAAEEKSSSGSEEVAETKEETKPDPSEAPSEANSEEPLEDALTSTTGTDSATTANNDTTPNEPSASSNQGGETGQSIGGLSVQGERLGVILDVSGSMNRYLESLRREIRAGFADAEFREVEGCFLEPIDPSAIPDPSTVSRESVMDAIAELVKNHQVDSIYWFCDLQDERTEEALQQLRTIALGQSGNYKPFRLYIRSTDEMPDPGLEEIIRSSGGAFERSRRTQ